MGCVTASCFWKVMTKARSGDGISQTAKTYANQIIGEVLSGRPAEEIKSKYLDWGNKHEPTARIQFLLRYDTGGKKLRLTGFQRHPTIGNCGGSPDFLLGDDEVGEIKCPYTSEKHIFYCGFSEFTAKTSKEYFWQTQGNMWVTGRSRLRFISYHPLFPRELQMHVIDVERDEDAMDDLDEEIPAFLEQVKIQLTKLVDNVCPQMFDSPIVKGFLDGQEKSSNE